MAPEVVCCETIRDNPYDYKADIWSLGITLIEFAQRDPPYGSMSPMRVLLKIQKGDPPRLAAPSKWTKEFNDFLAKCLIKDPSGRPTAAELLELPFLKKCDPVEEKKAILAMISEYKADVFEEVIEEPEDEECVSKHNLSRQESINTENSFDTSEDNKSGSHDVEVTLNGGSTNPKNDIKFDEQKKSKRPAPQPPIDVRKSFTPQVDIPEVIHEDDPVIIKNSGEPDQATGGVVAEAVVNGNDVQENDTKTTASEPVLLINNQRFEHVENGDSESNCQVTISSNHSTIINTGDSGSVNNYQTTTSTTSSSTESSPSLSTPPSTTSNSAQNNDKNNISIVTIENKQNILIKSGEKVSDDSNRINDNSRIVVNNDYGISNASGQPSGQQQQQSQHHHHHNENIENRLSRTSSCSTSESSSVASSHNNVKNTNIKVNVNLVAESDKENKENHSTRQQNGKVLQTRIDQVNSNRNYERKRENSSTTGNSNRNSVHENVAKENPNALNTESHIVLRRKNMVRDFERNNKNLYF